MNSSAFNGMANSMAGFNPMSHHVPSAVTPVTPSASMPTSSSSMSHIASVPPATPSNVGGPCGVQQQQQQSMGSYGCINGRGSSGIPSGGNYVDISSLSPYNRHHHQPHHHHHTTHHHHHSGMGSVGLGHSPMGPSATSVATHNYHQSVNGGQYGMHHNSHNSTGKSN